MDSTSNPITRNFLGHGAAIQNKTSPTTSRFRAACERCRQKKQRCSGSSGLLGRCDDCQKFGQQCNFERYIPIRKKRVDVRIKELETKIWKLSTQLQRWIPERIITDDGNLAGMEGDKECSADRQSSEQDNEINDEASGERNGISSALTNMSVARCVCIIPFKKQTISGPGGKSRRKSKTGCLTCKKRKLKVCLIALETGSRPQHSHIVSVTRKNLHVNDA